MEVRDKSYDNNTGSIKFNEELFSINFYNVRHSLVRRGLWNNNKTFRYISKRYMSTEPNKLNPWYVTGFLDGESSFTVSVCEDKSLKIG